MNCVNEVFVEMEKTPFIRCIPVGDLYTNQNTKEIHNRTSTGTGSTLTPQGQATRAHAAVTTPLLYFHRKDCREHYTSSSLKLLVLRFAMNKFYVKRFFVQRFIVKIIRKNKIINHNLVSIRVVNCPV